MICVRFASDLRQMNHALNLIYKERYLPINITRNVEKYYAKESKLTMNWHNGTKMARKWHETNTKSGTNYLTIILKYVLLDKSIQKVSKKYPKMSMKPKTPNTLQKEIKSKSNQKRW